MLLRAHRERPPRSRAAEERDELAAPRVAGDYAWTDVDGSHFSPLFPGFTRPRGPGGGPCDSDDARLTLMERTSPTSIVGRSSEALATMTSDPAPASAAKRTAAISPSSLAAIAPVVLAVALS